MSIRLLSLLAAALTVCAAQAGNIVCLSAARGNPGDEVTVTMEMSGTDAVSAIDMKLTLPPELAYVEGSAQLTARCPSHQVSASTVDGTLRLVAYSLSLADITGSSGEVLSFKLRLGDKPLTVALQPIVLLGNAAGDKLQAQTIAGEVQIRCAELTVESPQIDFGHIPIRSTYTSWLTLRNSGNEPMTVNSVTSDSPVVSVSANGEVIGAGESRQYEVTFNPTARGAFASKITIDCDAVNRLVHNRLHTADVIADPFSVNELHVDHVEGVSGARATVSVRMNDMEPITGMQATFLLPDGIDYVHGSAKLSTRAADHQIVGTLTGRQLTLLAFSPTNAAFTSDDGEVATFDVELNARSGWYYISPEKVKLVNVDAENMVSATYGEYVVIQSPIIVGDDSLDFGQQDVTAELTAAYRIENQGQAPLIIERVTFLADGFSVMNQLPLTIVPWESTSLEVAYSTTAAEAFATTMNIYCNDPQIQLKTVAISGTAFSPNSLSVRGTFDQAQGYTVKVDLNNHAEITALQFDLKVDKPQAVGSSLSITPTARLDDYSTVSSKIADGHFRVIAYVINDRTISGNSGEIMSLLLPLGTETPDALNVTLEKMMLSSADSKNLLSPAATASCAIGTFERGDANADRKLSVADVTAVVNCLNGIEPERFSLYGADANGDGQVTIGDATTIVNMLLGN